MSVRYMKTRSRNHFYCFDNTSELIDYTEEDLYQKRDPSFVGMDFKTWDDLETQTKKTWDYGAEVIESFVERLQKEEMEALKSRKRKAGYTSSDDGDGEMDWEKMMAGEDFWRTTKREDREGPGEITIITDTTAPATTNTDDILWRGGAALALTKILEERDYKVELWATNGSRLFNGEYEGVYTGCCLKRAGESFDMSNLCNTISGWFYRTATFSLLETICKNEGKQPAYGYGSAFAPTESDLDVLTPDHHRVYISNVYSFDASAKCVVGEIQRIASKSDEFKGDE